MHAFENAFLTLMLILLNVPSTFSDKYARFESKQPNAAVLA